MPSIKTAHLLKQGHPFRQWKTWRLPNTQWDITGYSRSNDKTFFHIPALRACIDAALCEGRQPEHVFLTHTHNDHVADLAFLASRSPEVSLYVPAQALPYVEAYIKARRELNHVAPFDPEKANDLTLRGVTPGERFSIGKRDQYAVEVVACDHKIPCVGYGFSQRKSRLKAEYVEQKEAFEQAGDKAAFGKLMAQLRKEGVEVQEQVEEPLVLFMGDTHASVFSHQPELLRYPVIFTECTFLHETEEERANAKGHTLWKQLLPTIAAHPENTFVLTHFSLRHSDREVLAFFEALAGEMPLDNIVLWAHTESLLPEQHQRS